METSIRNLLIAQVREHLNGLPVTARVRELIYTHFLPQCDQYAIPEDVFYKEILKDAFKAAEPALAEDPDPPNKKGTFVKLFGITLHSLKRLGEVLFEDFSRAQVYFEDVTLLKAHVDTLEDADAAILFSDWYKTESDPGKRYLKICYRLNPGLAYRIGDELFNDVEDLLTAGFARRALMQEIFEEYRKGYLHCWLHARSPDKFDPAPVDKKIISFLTLVYAVNPAFPFFIAEELVQTPKELATRLQADLNIWAGLMTCWSNGQLAIWFDALGYPEWRGQLQKIIDQLSHAKQLEDDEKTYAAIQQLLFIIDPQVMRPLLGLGESKIEKINLSTTALVEIPVKVSLKTLGYVRVQFTLEPAHDGLCLDKTTDHFFDLTGRQETWVTLSVDPQLLVKNKTYKTDLLVITDYERLTIPVSVSVVFPLPTYLVYVGKYALLGALLFAALRWLIIAGTGQSEGLLPRIITMEVERSLPDNWPAFYWAFSAMLVSLIGSYFMIRKVEKI
jgi:hypothetical protein